MVVFCRLTTIIDNLREPKEKMTSLHICHINLAKGFRGGERQTWLLINALAQDANGQLKQTVVLRKGSPLAPMFDNMAGVSVMEITKPFFYNTIKLSGFSLIHAHESKAAHIAFMTHRLYKTPYIITRRVPNPLKNNFFTRSVYVRANKVVAISKEIKRLLSIYDNRIPLDVIYSSFAGLPVDAVEVDRLRKKYQGRFVVGHVGALVNRHKGQIHLINVARKIHDQYPDIHFLFLGQGSDEGWFKKAAGGMDNIEFAGFKKNIGDYYNVLDVFVYPSMYEGLGSAVLDAFYFKVPVIASDVGGIPEMVFDGETGLLVEPKDEDALYEAIIQLYQDRGLGRRLAENGHHSLEKFDINTTKKQYLELYKTLTSG